MCRVSADLPFNLSQESLTSPQALQVLKRLPETDPDLWKELSKNDAQVPPLATPCYADCTEDDDPNKAEATAEFEDDHAITSEVLRNHLMHGDASTHGGFETENDHVVPTSLTETLSEDAADVDHEFADLNKDIPLPLDVSGDGRVEGPAAETVADGMNVPPLVASGGADAKSEGKRTRKPNQNYASAFWERH